MLMGVVDKAAAAFELVKAPHELELLLQLVLPLSSLPSKSKLAAARKLLSATNFGGDDEDQTSFLYAAAFST